MLLVCGAVRLLRRLRLTILSACSARRLTKFSRSHTPATETKICPRECDRCWKKVSPLTSSLGRPWVPVGGNFLQRTRKRVTDLFSELMIRTYSGRVVGTQRPKIAYGTPIELAPDRREIPTRVTTSTSNEPIAIVYRLIKLPGGWRIYDVLIEGVSFVANYRAQFDEIIQKGGAAAVIRTLETKLASPADSRS